MNLEKLGLILFIKYLRQFESVKMHLVSAMRELLMAMSSTLEITNQITMDNFLLGKIGTLGATFKKIDHVLGYSIKQLQARSHQNQSGTPPQQLKENIVESIISVIDEEIDKLAESSATNKDLKVDALNTVKDVLNNHISPQNGKYFDDIIEVEQASNS